MNKRAQKMAGFAVAAIVGVILLIAIGGAIVMLLWNWLAPALFRLPQIGFWQAVGLLALTRILFGGLGLPGGRSSKMRRRTSARWDDLTPEEQEKLRQEVRSRMAPPDVEANA